MSGTRTARMISAYNQEASPTMYFSGMFNSPPQNFYNSEEVEIDIVRSEEDVSVVVHDISTGHRMNVDDVFTNKAFKAPVHKEAIAIESFELLKRMPGDNPFENPEFRGNLITRVFAKMRKIEAKVRRSVELQASQVMQTGTVSLIDEAGTVLYTIDYKPKATHFPTAGTTWGTGTEDKLADLEALADVIRADGLSDPDEIIFGSAAWGEFIKDTDVQALLDNRRMDLGAVAPANDTAGKGAKYMGWIQVGSYRMNMYTYSGRYKHPQTGVSTKYMAPEKVVMRDSMARMDATFGGIPNIGKLLGVTGPGLLPEMPGRFSNVDGRMDLHVNAWVSENGESLTAGIGARPLMIPTAIDTFGCLDTGL